MLWQISIFPVLKRLFNIESWLERSKLIHIVNKTLYQYSVARSWWNKKLAWIHKEQDQNSFLKTWASTGLTCLPYFQCDKILWSAPKSYYNCLPLSGNIEYAFSIFSREYYPGICRPSNMFIRAGQSFDSQFILLVHIHFVSPYQFLLAICIVMYT